MIFRNLPPLYHFDGTQVVTKRFAPLPDKFTHFQNIFPAFFVNLTVSMYLNLTLNNLLLIRFVKNYKHCLRKLSIRGIRYWSGRQTFDLICQKLQKLLGKIVNKWYYVLIREAILFVNPVENRIYRDKVRYAQDLVIHVCSQKSYQAAFINAYVGLNVDSRLRTLKGLMVC